MREAAIAVLACVLGAALCAGGAILLAGSLWHPPGEGLPADIKCRQWVKDRWVCEGLRLPRPPFPGMWPRWEMYPEKGPRCDYAEGTSVTLYPLKGQAHLIVMKPNLDPSSWRRLWIMQEFRQHPGDK